IGISLYLDYMPVEQCCRLIDQASSLGYTDIFTSFNFEEYTFPGKRNDSKGDRRKLFDYAAGRNMVFHVDITRNLLISMGGRPEDLSCFMEIGIPVIRLDGGFSDDEITVMTKNSLGIMIEDNLANYPLIERTLEAVKEKGNLDQYSACLNFYPRNDTGLDIDEAVKAAENLKKAGCQTGAFIGSLYSPTQMNSTSRATPSIEAHRYLPADIQLAELLCTGAFDFILFGDSEPRCDELHSCAHVLECYKEGYVEIPCWFDDIDPDIIARIKDITFLSRIDRSAKVIRGTQSRGIVMKPYNTIERNPLTITLDNDTSNQYTGELQIVLEPLPAERFINVIGYVRPYAARLLKHIHDKPIKFKLK
ncbi:MAG: DUF871 family protein, partial [Erysipelotrichaceae bacterium]|nr:DUF871 family protein [Erysipelotrichaceae bacterium]